MNFLRLYQLTTIRERNEVQVSFYASAGPDWLAKAVCTQAVRPSVRL